MEVDVVPGYCLVNVKFTSVQALNKYCDSDCHWSTACKEKPPNGYI